MADPPPLCEAPAPAWRRDGSAASKATLKEVDALLDGIARASLGMK